MVDTVKIIEATSEAAQQAEQLTNQRVVSIKQIPSSIWDRSGEAIEQFVRTEIDRIDSERYDQMRKFARMRVLYDAPVPEEPKTFPFEGASNLTEPLVKEYVNTISAQIAQSTLTVRPYWIFKDLAPEWEPFTDDLEDFCDIIGERELNYELTMSDAIVDTVKLGTQVLEIPWEVEFRSQYRFTRNGDEAYKKNIKVKDGPTLRIVPIQNFGIRIHDDDLQKATLVYKRFFIKFGELKRFLWTKRMDEALAEEIGKHLVRKSEDDEVRDAEELALKQVQLYGEEIDIREIHLRYDVDGDNRTEDLILYYHKDSDTILGKFFAHYWHGKRPFIKMGFSPRPGFFYDEGLAEMIEQFQMEISAIKNRRGDNATLANMPMFIKRRNSTVLRQGEPLFLGKIMQAQDIWNDIREFRISELYPSTVNEETLARTSAERLAGMNEGVAGAAMPVTRTTATAQLALLQEQAKRLGFAISNIRRAQKEIIQFVFDLFEQFGTQGKAVAWLGKKRGQAIDGVFSLPMAVVALKSGVNPNAPTSASNRQIKRESSIAMFNLLVQMYSKIIELVAGTMGPEMLAPIVRDMVHGAKKFMGDALEAFENTDPDGILAGLTTLEKLLPVPGDLGGGDSYERSAERAEILAQVGRLEDLYKYAGQQSDGEVRITGRSDRGSGNVETPGGVDRNLALAVLSNGSTGRTGES